LFAEPHIKRSPGTENSVAFTLVELLVVIAIIGILAALLLPLFPKVKMRTQSIQCMNNHRQLLLAWNQYIADSADRLPFASRDPSRPDLDRFAWTKSELDFSPFRIGNWDPSIDLKTSLLWNYGANLPAIWKCPADTSIVRPGFGPDLGKPMPRVRSMSMNIWVGGFGGRYASYMDRNYQVFLTLSEISALGHAKAWVFLDQREDSINWGNYYCDMAGYPDQPKAWQFVCDYPASYHHRAGGFSFADGHAEIKKWQDSRTMPPITKNSTVLCDQGAQSSPGNPDLKWIMERSTVRVR
jgi:prepilin-type N-terminal cleavage/methylation domain-containing protein